MTRSGMRKSLVLSLALAICFTALTIAGCDSRASVPAVYQVSTLQALMMGAYEGQIPCGELSRYGTLGIGTFDGLDGELIMIDGIVYKATAEGSIIANPSDTIPFANVTRFQPQTVLSDVEGPSSLEELHVFLDTKANSRNLLYAVRIDGEFQQVKVRSVPRQKQPYPPLVEAVKEQRTFDRQEVRGTLVGFRFPDYFIGLNMPGWHLHFISDDRSFGGHVLALGGGRMEIKMQTIGRFEMTLPESGTFVEAEIGRDMYEEIHRVEK